MPALTSLTSSLKRRSEEMVVLRDDDIFAGEARVEPLADDAFEHQQAGGLVLLAGREDFLDLGAADDRLDDLRSKLAGHRALHPVGEVIDDVVVAQLDLVARRRLRAPWHWGGR